MRTLMCRGFAIAAVAGLQAWLPAHGQVAAGAAPEGRQPPARIAAAATDLDLLMEAVLANREQSWRKLQEYLLAERESFRLLGPGGSRMFGSEREYLWVVRDGRAVRSPVRVNGVAVGEAERRRREAQWQKEEDERRTGAERHAPPPETAAEVEAVLKDGEPRFVSEVQFLRFRFEPGNYYLAGRETLAGRPVLRVEYYPHRLFEDHANTRRGPRERTRAGQPATDGSREAAVHPEDRIEDALNKVSLVTLWVDPALKQILRYTFDNVDFGFLPGRSLVRIDQARATMSMGQPFEGVWLPESLSVEGAVTLAAGTFRAEYRRRFQDYRQADVQVRFRVNDENR